MYTLVDFVTHVKGVEYLLALTFIVGYLIFWEALKPRPFRAVVNLGKEDLQYIRQTGYGNVVKSAGRIAAAPFIGLAYVVMIPFVFFSALFVAAVNGVLKGVSALMSLAGKSVSFEWRPMEAYLTGRKKKQEKSKK